MLPRTFGTFQSHVSVRMRHGTDKPAKTTSSGPGMLLQRSMLVLSLESKEMKSQMFPSNSISLENEGENFLF